MRLFLFGEVRSGLAVVMGWDKFRSGLVGHGRVRQGLSGAVR